MSSLCTLWTLWTSVDSFRTYETIGGGRGSIPASARNCAELCRTVRGYGGAFGGALLAEWVFAYLCGSNHGDIRDYAAARGTRGRCAGHLVAAAIARRRGGDPGRIARGAGTAQPQSTHQAVARRQRRERRQRRLAVRGGVRRPRPRPGGGGLGHPLPQRRGGELHRALHAPSRPRLHGGGGRGSVRKAAFRGPLRHPVRTRAPRHPRLARRAGVDRPAVRLRQPPVRLRLAADRPTERGVLRRRARRPAGHAARHRHRRRFHAARHHLPGAAVPPHPLRRPPGGGAQPHGRHARDPLPQPVSRPERQEGRVRRAAHHRRERGLDHRARIDGGGGHPLRQHRHHHARGRQRRRQERDAGARTAAGGRAPPARREHGDRRAPFPGDGADLRAAPGNRRHGAVPPRAALGQRPPGGDGRGGRVVSARQPH